jgi:hypothetical protein
MYSWNAKSTSGLFICLIVVLPKQLIFAGRYGTNGRFDNKAPHSILRLRKTPVHASYCCGESRVYRKGSKFAQVAHGVSATTANPAVFSFYFPSLTQSSSTHSSNNYQFPQVYPARLTTLTPLPASPPPNLCFRNQEEGERHGANGREMG